MEQIVKLNPITLQPDENGQPYRRIVIGSNIILCADSAPLPETPQVEGEES